MNKDTGYDDFPILAELYDLVPAYLERSDPDFYIQYCRETKGDILELGSGTGRILIPVAEAGCRITGLDLSENMLSRCRNKLMEAPKDVQNRVQIIQGNMVNFNLNRKFELAIIPFRPFQHIIDVNDQLSCLRCISQHLKTGGRFILEVFQVNFEFINKAKSGEEIQLDPEVELPDGRRMRRAHRITSTHRAEQYNDIEIVYYLTDTDGTTNRYVHAFPFRYFFRYEVEHLLARSGFRIIDLFGNFDKSPFTDESPEMIFITEKAETVDL